MFTVEQASRMYRVPVSDYDGAPTAYSDRRSGLLVSSGCGIMMAVMDVSPLRYCTDTDGLRGQPSWLLERFLVTCAAAGPVAVCGWFSYSDPAPLRDAILAIGRPIPVYAGHIRLDVPGEVDSFTAFVDACRELK